MRHQLLWLPIIWNVTIASANAQDVGAWKVTHEKSALTDFESVYGVVDEEGDGQNFVGRAVKAQFFVACHQKLTAVLFNFEEYMGKGRLLFKYRIDDGKVGIQFGDVSENGRAFGFWGSEGRPFLKLLEGKSKLVIAAEPYGEGAREAVFPIDGIDRVVSDVRKACNW